jgi:hypothetical protein
VNKDGTVVSYLQLAHNERHPVTGSPVAKVIHSFGRADKVDRAALARLVASISRFLDPGQGDGGRGGRRGGGDRLPADGRGVGAGPAVGPAGYRHGGPAGRGRAPSGRGRDRAGDLRHPARSGRGGPPQFPPPPSERSAPRTPDSPSRLPFQDLHRFHGLHRDSRGSALSHPLTTRQASLDATDRSVAPLL